MLLSLFFWGLLVSYALIVFSDSTFTKLRPTAVNLVIVLLFAAIGLRIFWL